MGSYAVPTKQTFTRPAKAWQPTARKSLRHREQSIDRCEVARSIMAVSPRAKSFSRVDKTEKALPCHGALGHGRLRE